MKAIPQKRAVSPKRETAKTAPSAELPGVLPARDGLQPVMDLNAFLQSLPDFGPDAATLREAIAEDRALRRAMDEGDAC
jgi:hypothetical protein